MKKLFPLIIAIGFFSCQSEQQKLKQKIDPILQNIVLQDSIAAKVDSIKIYKVDTLSDLRYAQRQINNLNAEIDYFLSVEKNYLNQSNLKKESASLELSQERLYASINSRVLVQTERDEITRDVNDMKELIKEGQNYSDSATIAINKSKQLQLKIDRKQLNSKNFRGYVILFKVLGYNKKNIEVKRDSLNIYLSPNFRIIPILSIK